MTEESRLARLELRYTDKRYDFPTGKQKVAAALYEWGLSRGPQEVGWVVAFDADFRVHTFIEVARGTQRLLPIHMPTLLGAVLASGTDRFMFVHSHPGSMLQPSEADMVLTKQISDAAAVCGLYFEDHLIVTNDPTQLFSFKMNGLYFPPTHVVTEASRYGGS